MEQPDILVYTKMEGLIKEMQHPESGVPVRCQKAFLVTFPSVFTGYDLVEWLMERLSIEDSAEAVHLANLMCQYGYYFPVPDSKNLIVRDDGSYYRFQAPYFWTSRKHNPDSTEYAIYLMKRSLRNKQKHGLEDYETESFNMLKKQLSHKWEFVTMQAEEQLKLGKVRKKPDKIIMDSQEKAHWRVHRPPPGYICYLESPPSLLRNGTRRKCKERDRKELVKEILYLQEAVIRTKVKISQASEGLIGHFETYCEYDPLVMAAQPSNPWVSDDAAFFLLWEHIVEVPTERRVRRWAISLFDLLSDPTGLQEFESYLQKEYSHENIRFWRAVEDLRKGPQQEMEARVKAIYNEFLAGGAPCEVNLDCKTIDATQQAMKKPTRFTFDAAQRHVYSLMKKDSYPRFLRSDTYKTLVSNGLQPSQKKRFFNFGAVVKKKTSPSGAAPTVQVGTMMTGNKLRSSSSNLSGSTNDLSDAGSSASTRGTSQPLGHSLSASNLHDLEVSESHYRLASTMNIRKEKRELSVPASQQQNPEKIVKTPTAQRSISEISVREDRLDCQDPVCPWEGAPSSLSNTVCPWED